MPELNRYIAEIRSQFPILNQDGSTALIYLDNAATTQKPQAVISAVSDYYQTANANVHRASHRLSAIATQQFETARELVASYLNANSSREIIWTRGTTEGINLIANSWGNQLQPGDEIIVSRMEHHANIVPWQMLAQRRGIQIKVLELTESGELDLEQLDQLLNEKTRLVTVTHVSNVLGTINPIRKIADKVHQAGALLLVDGAQALPHLEINLTELGADFYLFSGHKVFAPTGVGVLWCRESILEQLPPWQGGGEMIKSVSFEHTEYNDLPFRFEAGTPNISGVLGLAAALRWLQQQERKQLEQHEQHLLSVLKHGCQQIKGFTPIGNPTNRVSLLSFTLDTTHQHDLGMLLDQQGFAVRTGHHCAMPLMEKLGLTGTTRASFAFYNTEQEVIQFLEALDMISREQQITVTESAPQHQEPLTEKLLILNNWNARYREIMLAGKKHPAIPEQYKNEQYLIRGCESNTWLHYEVCAGKVYFKLDSEARIIRGLLAILLEQFDQRSAAQILCYDIDKLFNELGLERHLSPSRGNGLRAVVDKIKLIAQQIKDSE